ncbi:5'/3'-nucleotidase SurE [Salinirussus salinus]|jgi:5'-nucleotidase|uniref:5'/3'-nucleotidase SurE n=1 Tax=Salinirussus salinus TaxID=1198300 RepID=UPI00135838E5|nr:5'/3'-nucleotidase SurE [Salinirussus salinus]
MDDPRILLTNDDGIDAAGLLALKRGLADVGSVTAVAPQTNMSGTGRALSLGRSRALSGELSIDVHEGDNGFSFDVPYTDHDNGYAVDGTPCDCVVGGHALDPAPDLVVSGCNPGANTGQYTVSRSGTVSAAMEGALLGTPSVAISMDTLGSRGDLTVDDFDRASRLTTTLVERAIDHQVFSGVDFLNVSIPDPDEPVRGVAVTRPDTRYGLEAVEGGESSFRIRAAKPDETGEEVDSRAVPTDRAALAQNFVAVSPFHLPTEPTRTEAVETVARELSAEFGRTQAVDPTPGSRGE